MKCLYQNNIILVFFYHYSTDSMLLTTPDFCKEGVNSLLHYVSQPSVTVAQHNVVWSIKFPISCTNLMDTTQVKKIISLWLHLGKRQDYSNRNDMQMSCDTFFFENYTVYYQYSREQVSGVPSVPFEPTQAFHHFPLMGIRSAQQLNHSSLPLKFWEMSFSW